MESGEADKITGKIGCRFLYFLFSQPEWIWLRMDKEDIPTCQIVRIVQQREAKTAR